MKKFIFITAMMLIVALEAFSHNNDSLLVVPPIYESLDILDNGYIVVQNGGKEGCLNSKGEILIPIKYDFIKGPKFGTKNNQLFIAAVKKEEAPSGLVIENILYEYCLYNNAGEIIVPLRKYGKISFPSFPIEPTYLAEVSVIVNVFDVAEDYIGTPPANWKPKIHRSYETKDGVLDNNLRLIASETYDDVEALTDKLLKVKKDGKVGLINSNGKVVVPIGINDDFDAKLVNNYDKQKCKYFIKARNSKKQYSVYNENGSLIVPAGKYKRIDVKSECIIVENNEQKGVLSLKGTPIIPVGLYSKIYEIASEDKRHLYIEVYKGDKMGAVSLNGKLFVPCGKYDSFKVLDDNLTLVTLNHKKGIINRNGDVVVPIGKYSDIKYEYGILYYSQYGPKYGIINKSGKQATLDTFDSIKPERRSFGVALVNKGGKIGLVDSEGHIIMPLEEYTDGRFYGDVGMLKKSEGTVFFLKNGKILSNYGKYEDAENKFGKLRVLKLDANEGLFVIESNAKKGLVKLW